jgi:DNA-binding MarR family transcriptional regulator
VNLGGSGHPLKTQLKHSIAGCGTADEVVEAVMAVLHANRLVLHRDADALPILTPAGRVMVDLALHPDSTLRELSIRQGTTESSVTKQMTHLVEAKLVERTRVGKRNSYTLNLNEVLHHPDISVLVEAIIITAQQQQ